MSKSPTNPKTCEESLNEPDLFVVALDVEGTLMPEAWLALQEKTGLEELKLTTAHEPDYDKLMKYRIDCLRKNNIKLQDMKDIVKDLKPLPGAIEFLEWLKPIVPRILLLTDTFEEYAMPMFEKMGYPAVFCNSMTVDKEGFITGHVMRLHDQKRKAVEAFQRLNFRIIACGDSFNDISMLKAAERGILYCPHQKVIDAHPEFPVVYSHTDLRTKVGRILAANRRVIPRQLQPEIPAVANENAMWLLICNVAGTLAPEPWLALQKKTGIEELKITTAHEPDYNKIMERRMAALRKHNIKLHDVVEAAEAVDILPGAKDFLEWLKTVLPRTFMITDTFEEYATNICDRLGHPMVFCNFLEAGEDGFLNKHVIRMRKPPSWTSQSSYQKVKAVEEFKRLNFKIIAVGFSFNDVGMLRAAEKGILFNPSEHVTGQVGDEFSVARNYEDLKEQIVDIISKDASPKRAGRSPPKTSRSPKRPRTE